jgi:hypothetical protein
VRFRRGITVGLALIAVAVVVAAAAVALPRIQHRRALARAIETNDTEALEKLSEDADAVLALLDYRELWEHQWLRHAEDARIGRTIALRHGVELFATTREPRDSRVEERLRAWAGPESWPFEPVYLLEELASPRYADRRSALDHDDEPRGISGNVYGNVEPEALARELKSRLDGAGQLARVSISTFDFVEPRKALCAWAACSGCELREQADVLQVVRREQRR